MLEKFERYPLTFGPTPIEKLERLGAHLGGEVLAEIQRGLVLLEEHRLLAEGAFGTAIELGTGRWAGSSALMRKGSSAW